MPRPATRAKRLLQRLVIRLAGGRRLTVTLRPRPRLSRALLALLACAGLTPAWALDPGALPSGGQVVAGQAGIQQSGNQLTINQTSDKAILNWQSFNIGSAASVQFNQPGTNSVALNRVLGNDPSQLHGKLSANGQVFISNPNGVLFGAGSQVNVGGLVATTLSLGDADFMQSRYTLNGDSQATVSNAGSIQANGGVALVAATVRNDGNIQARDVALAAGNKVSLDLHGDGLLSLRVDANALRGEIANGGAIQAGDQVIMQAASADALAGSVVNNSGIVRATGISNEGGRIRLGGGLVNQTGTLDASAAQGGSIAIAAHTLMDAGTTQAQGTTGQGGSIRVEAEQITQTASAQMNVDGSRAGGSIHLQGGAGEYGKFYSSANLSAQGTGVQAKGGSIAVTAASTQLRAATLDASGTTGGGTIEVGGGWQGGNATVANARETGVNASTTLKADAKSNGDGGTVVVWSDEKTTFAGHISATGGSQGGNGGTLEVSGKNNLIFAGTVDTASPFGLGGSLLLDPKNITISDATALFDVLNLDDPNPGAGNSFGASAVEVGSGNIAVTASGSDIGGITDTGAAYLFDGQNGALISALVGSNANDRVGNGGITALSNGNYVVRSASWDGYKGAVTWGNGNTGISGTVSAANSLVGSNANDGVGWDGITALSNSNYVIRSTTWDGYKGAVTWGNGATGITGILSSANSLVGSNANDSVGSDGITALSNGNYVVTSSYWNSANGAATWGNGTTGITGFIDGTNSLVGNASERVGDLGSLALSNGNYIVRSTFWNNWAGAVTWGDGNVGVSGQVDENNSLVGVFQGDRAGQQVTLLSNGNYVVVTNHHSQRGAVTWGNGDMGTTGIISASNSLVGSNANDRLGNGGITALSNGNYVVSSPNWDGTKGAVTWVNGGTAITGTVNAVNSLVGSNTNDRVGWGGITALSNGHYVVGSYTWDGNKGAATWGNGNTGVTGTVSATNSLVGSDANDSVGNGGITALSNGNYVVRSTNWNGTKGAVTWGDGATGISGSVNASNSLIGSAADDRVGAGGIAALSNGNYVVGSQYWNDYRGAVTWGNGTGGTTGELSANNSLVGSNANDVVGLGGITALSNGNYVVTSQNWNGNRGAVTWGNGDAGTNGILSAGNSLIGSTTGDRIGSNGITELSDGRILVRSPQQTINGLNTGRVSLVDFTLPDLVTAFADNPSDDLTINPQRLVAILNAGTAVTLQANNDILFNSALSLNNPGGNGGHLTLQAGRNITFNASLDTDNGNLTAVAGDPGAVAAQREAGTPTLTLANGITLNVGTGTAILAAIGGNVINNAGANAIQTSGAGRYLIYSSNPTDTVEGMAGYNKRYNQGFTLGSVPAYADSGNWFLYSIAPVLSVTPDASSQTYGDLSLAGLGYGLSGFIDGDDAASAGISGSATFTSNATAGSDVGNYNLAYTSGLLSALGYTFSDAVASTGELSITQRLISLAATAASKIYGETDPTLGVTVSAGSLGNGDTLADITGTLSREAGENVGSYDLALGTGLKAGNYSITFDADNNAISITPRALFVQAQNASRMVDEVNPLFSAAISGWAFNDSLADLQGSLDFSTQANQASPVGGYAITPFGLTSTNYQVQFLDGLLNVLAQQPQPSTPPASGQSPLVASQVGAQASILLGASAQPGGSMAPGSPPAAAGLGQWLQWISEQLLAWSAPGAQSTTGQALVQEQPGTQTSTVSTATLLASANDDHQELGGLIIRNGGVRLP